MTKKFDTKKLLRELKADFTDTICLIGDSASPKSLAPGRIPTGAINLDWATGGGIPTGRITELYSRKESEGKSTLACSIVKQAQAMGAQCIYLDTEQVSMGTRLVKLGLDMSSLVYVQPESVESALAITDEYITKVRAMGFDGPIVAVVDSVAAMNTQAQMEAKYDANTIASLAQVLSKGIRKLNKVVSDNDVALIMTNQVRERIGITYGDTLITPGGKALKFYSSLRIELKTKEKIYEQSKGTKRTIGIMVTATVKKSKVGMPFQQAMLDFMAAGLDPVSAAFRFGLQRHLIDRDGTFYSFDGIKPKFQKAKFADFLTEHPEVNERLKQELDKSLTEDAEVPVESVETEEVTEEDDDS